MLYPGNLQSVMTDQGWGNTATRKCIFLPLDSYGWLGETKSGASGKFSACFAWMKEVCEKNQRAPAKNFLLVQLHFYKISKTILFYQRNWKVQTNSFGKLEAFPVQGKSNSFQGMWVINSEPQAAEDISPSVCSKQKPEVSGLSVGISLICLA